MGEQIDYTSNIDAEKLLLSVNSGDKLSDVELERVAHAIEQISAISNEQQKNMLLDDLYSLILVIGRARAMGYKSLLEKQLYSKDAFVIALVLEIMCLEWGFIEDYLEQIISFAVGMSWDEENDLQLMAVKILGEYLAQIRNNDDGSRKLGIEWKKLIAQQLHDIFNNEQHEQWVRQGAYYALCRAGGKSWADLPGECAVIDLKPNSPDIDWELIESLL
ncbi:MAG: hypothetical protein IT292_11645 [Deltaproteobacteria bacterium]|nr:hypothetical protein [Deltaproteobacteria bacterium]